MATASLAFCMPVSSVSFVIDIADVFIVEQVSSVFYFVIYNHPKQMIEGHFVLIGYKPVQRS